MNPDELIFDNKLTKEIEDDFNKNYITEKGERIKVYIIRNKQAWRVFYAFYINDEFIHNQTSTLFKMDDKNIKLDIIHAIFNDKQQQQTRYITKDKESIDELRKASYEQSEIILNDLLNNGKYEFIYYLHEINKHLYDNFKVQTVIIERLKYLISKLDNLESILLMGKLTNNESENESFFNKLNSTSLDTWKSVIYKMEE